MSSHNRPHRYRTLGLSTSLAMVALLMTSDVGQAQEPAAEGKSSVRYERKSQKTKAQSDLLDTKFKAEKEKIDKERDRGVQMMDGQQFATKRKAVEQDMADKQIEFLKRLIKTSEENDPEYPDYLFRLADHY